MDVRRTMAWLKTQKNEAWRVSCLGYATDQFFITDGMKRSAAD